jgi:hypothetical protein
MGFCKTMNETRVAPTKPRQKPTPGRIRLFLLYLAVCFVLLTRLTPGGFSDPWIYVAPLAFYAWIWVAATVQTRRKEWIAAEQEYEPVDPDEPSIPMEVARRNKANSEALQSLGFSLLGHYRLGLMQPTVADCLISAYQNSANRDTARLVTILMRNAARPVNALAFVTEYVDGTTFTTTNLVTPAPFPYRHARPGSMTFPQVLDPRKLYEIHRVRAERDVVAGPVKGDAAARLEEEWRRNIAGWVQDGYYADNGSGERLQVTWKGAIVAVTKYIWPIGTLRRRLRYWRAGAELRRLKSEGLVSV